MKKWTIYMLVILSLTSCYDPDIQESKSTNVYKSKVDTTQAKQAINIAGSTTMSPIIKLVAAYFQKTNDIIINIKEEGSNEGIHDVFHDAADIAMSSNKISDSLSRAFRKDKTELAEFLLAGDALVFIVNINNPIKKLTEAQLKSIFQGDIINWKTLGGNDEAIKILSRDRTSGTFNFFKGQILDHEDLPASTEYFKEQTEILKHVGKERNAIGYISFSKLDYSIDPLNISFDEGKTYVQPRIETVHNLKYKYYRGLYLYYKPEAYNKIKAFLDSAKSDTVQKIIRMNGYIPLSHRLIANH